MKFSPFKSFFPLSIRSQIILMILGTIILVQSAALYAGTYFKEKFLEDIVSKHLTTSIQIIRSAVALLPPEERATFIRHSSRGKWSLWTRELPQAFSNNRSQPHRLSKRNNLSNHFFSDDHLPSDRPQAPSILQQLFPNLKENTQPKTQRQALLRFTENEPTPLLFSPVMRQDLKKFIDKINANLDDGTRVGLSIRDNIPLMYLSLQPEYNPFKDTLIKEWLVIPLDDIEPVEGGIFLLAWVIMTGLLILFAIYFSWRITTPLMRLSQSADQLAKGIHVKVVPAGPYETKKLGERFNAMLNSLEQAKTVQQTLLAGLPHDLKGPLARMRLRLEMTDDEFLKQGMSNDVQEMQNIIEQFISYVRGSDHTRYNFVPLDINKWLDERINAWQQAGTDISLKALPKETLHISGDTLSLGRMIDNIIGNALKHGKPPIDVYLYKKDKQVLLSICDHGPGIPEDRREEALRAFSRLDSARTKTGSVGLGLALVETIVHAHKGTLSLDSHKPCGLKINILLPLIA
ncbi:histidine kinase [Pelistega sp. NLN82]|uniref:histidine kinase n=1 Tax=Pelistega ratti TaxID=2652177 RepID=A0A6L9Y6L4_9BURK|nr:ATP-binding protein [Pelistega ratti]NEN76102.1 histidine kinase [Pelistega ratti]